MTNTPPATIHLGDCIEVMRTLPENSVDAIVTDPPYGLGFMGKAWDELPPGEEWARECLRVLKPGGHLLAFGGSRTWHRLAVAVEDAGFEVRDSIAWLYGSGFPKSLDVSKAIDKTAPRAGMFDAFAAHFWERWQASGMSRRDFVPHFPHYKNAESVMAQMSNWKLAKNVPSRQDFEILRALIGLSGEWEILIARVEAERDVVGAGYRVDRQQGHVNYGSGTPDGHYDITAPATDDARKWAGFGTALKPAFEPIVVARKPLVGTVAANVLAHGTGALNIDGCRVTMGEGDRVQWNTTHTPGAGKADGWDRPWMADAGEMNRRNQAAVEKANTAGRWPANVVLDESQAAALDQQSGTLTSGANPTRRGSDKFREAYGDFKGQQECTPARGADSGGASRFFPTFKYQAKAPTSERIKVDGIAHPTVKPLALMRWLVRLVTPPGGTVLEPFAGSGTTVEACALEGFACIAIEREPDYLPLIQARLARVEAAQPEPAGPSLFDMEETA